MRKLISVFLLTTLVFSLCACTAAGEKDDPSVPSFTAGTPGETTLPLEYTGTIPEDFLTELFPSEIPPSEPDAILPPQPTVPAVADGVGPIQAQLDRVKSTDDFTVLIPVEADPDGEGVLLFADVALTDVTLEFGSWNQDCTEFQPESLLLFHSELAVGEAVWLHTYFSDVLPNIRLTYTAEGISYTCFLFQSGMDGSIILMAP